MREKRKDGSPPYGFLLDRDVSKVISLFPRLLGDHSIGPTLHFKALKGYFYAQSGRGPLFPNLDISKDPRNMTD
jgi:hypothetical protein